MTTSPIERRIRLVLTLWGVDLIRTRRIPESLALKRAQQWRMVYGSRQVIIREE